MKKWLVTLAFVISVTIGIYETAVYPTVPDTYDSFSLGRLLGHYPQPPVLYDVGRQVRIDAVLAYKQDGYKLYVKGTAGYTVINLFTREINQVSDFLRLPSRDQAVFRTLK